MKQPQQSELSLYLDDVRIAMYSTFLFLSILGGILTKYATDIFSVKPTLIDWWFGSTNLCVVFDFSPSSLVIPAFYAVFLIFWILMEALLWFRQKEAYMAGQISRGWYWLLNYFRIQESLSAIYFTTIFAVNPDLRELSEGNPTTMIIHTVPYFFMIIAFTNLAIGDVLYDLFTGFASIRGMSETKRSINWAWYLLAAYPLIILPPCLFIMLHIVNVLLKPPQPLVPWRYIPDQWNVTAYGNLTLDQLPCIENNWPSDPTCSGYAWCANCPNFMDVVTAMDHIKTLLVLIPPWVKAIISSIWLRDRIYRLNISIMPHFVDTRIVSVDDDKNYVNLDQQ